jgi:hypothetical protein
MPKPKPEPEFSILLTLYQLVALRDQLEADLARQGNSGARSVVLDKTRAAINTLSKATLTR